MRSIRTPAAGRTAALLPLLLPALLLASGCSSGSGGGTDGSGGTPSARSVLTGKAPLSKAQLAKALVTDQDLPGWIVQPSQTDRPAETATLTADRPQCQPLADVTSSDPKIHRMAYVGAAFARSTTKSRPDAINQMLVASHAPGDAHKVIDAVRTALGQCTSFTAIDNTGTKTPFRVAKGPAVPTGDAAVSYVMTDAADKKTGAALVTVVQTGDTVTAYLSVKASGGAGEVPVDVARKQDAKLRAVLAKQR
ncbi:sensor domain-containing protein [Streptomyces sp. HPF1205]|uniref:sensor domain-containing protein n=1 Tax=Streptomyces sp. HPF1205 TaxID=2873262 RepID=UPI001CEDBD73|nr:sensor domain-containing protein [Streptomyces sp. HPF1205]